MARFKHEAVRPELLFSWLPRTRLRRLAVTQLAAWLVAVMLMSVGCEPPPRPPIKTVENKSNADLLSSQLSTPQVEAFERPQLDLKFTLAIPYDLWDACFLGSAHTPIGYSHMRAEPTRDSEEVRYTLTERLLLRQGDQVVEQILRQSSLETLSGQLKSFTAEYSLGNQVASAKGQIKSGNLEVTIIQGGETSQRQIPWRKEYGGLLALPQNLMEKPLRTWDKQSINLLAPVFYELGKLELSGVGQASVTMLDGKFKLLQEIAVNSSIAGNDISSMSLWTDEEGNVLKQFIRGPTTDLNLQMYRSDEATATSLESPIQGLVADFKIPLDKTIDGARPLRAVGFIIQPKGDQNALQWLPQTDKQNVKADGGKFQVAITDTRAATETGDEQADIAEPPGPGDKRPGSLIQSEASLIQQLADQVRGADKAELALELANLVHTHLRQPSSADSFASALSAANSGSGDCTEHALLLAALCRARGIPARIAAGLIYEDGTATATQQESETEAVSQTEAEANTDEPHLRFHMWTEVYIDEQWVGLDATLESGQTSLDRITMLRDNLAERTDFSLFQTVRQAAETMQIELRRVFYQ
ncbi:transglutaminase-like domain-containing protein [Planctomycetaceae bacterium SH139]